MLFDGSPVEDLVRQVLARPLESTSHDALHPLTHLLSDQLLEIQPVAPPPLISKASGFCLFKWTGGLTELQTEQERGDGVIVRTAEDSQPKTQSRSSRSLSVTVSSRETPSCGSRGEDSETLIHTAVDPSQRRCGTHHSLAVHPDVDLPLGGALQDVFGRDAAGDLERVEEHVAVEAVPRSLHAWGRRTKTVRGEPKQQTLLQNVFAAVCDSASSFLL